MPKLNGILETAFYVEDLARSIAFYKSLFALETLVEEGRFCALNVAGRHVLLLFKKGASRRPVTLPGGVIPPHDGEGQSHAAFSISTESLAAWEQVLAERNVSIESRVRWERGGTSLYFRDPDGNLLELVTPGIWAIY